MEMQFKNEIGKLSDIAVWADGIIRDAGYNDEKYKNDGVSAFCHVKAHELWKVRDVALKSIDRHTVYTNELNKDIAEKAAKINLLEKEIEGRKEGYWALKEKYDKLEKELEIRTKENESLIAVKNRLEKERDASDKDAKYWKEAFETRATSLASDRVEELEKQVVELRECRDRAERRYTSECKLAEEKCNEVENLEEDNKALRTANEILVEKSKEHLDEIKKLEKQLKKCISIEEHNRIVSQEYCKDQERIRGEDDHGRAGFKRYIEHLIEEEERAVPERFKERLNKEITEIFTKEEETEVNDIPCGSDSIE